MKKERYPWLEDIECGNEVPAGWETAFMNQMYDEINAVIEEENITNFEVFQIKEKYGSLRFYYAPYNDRIDKIIKDYEDISTKTCCGCGQKATVVSTGWISSWCDECAQKIHDNFVPIATFYMDVDGLD